MVKQISDNEIYMLIKYIKSFLWGVVKRLSYTEDARWLNVKCNVQGKQARVKNADLRHPPSMCSTLLGLYNVK